MNRKTLEAKKSVIPECVLRLNPFFPEERAYSRLLNPDWINQMVPLLYYVILSDDGTFLQYNYILSQCFEKCLFIGRKFYDVSKISNRHADILTVNSSW